MLGHFTEGISWIISIFFYIVFTLISCFLIRNISFEYHTCGIRKKWTLIDKDLFFINVLFLFFMIVILSSFRYIRPDVQVTANNIGGIDSVTYRKYYNLCKGISYAKALKLLDKEWLFVLIFWSCKNLGMTFDFCLVLLNFLMFVAFINYAKHYNLTYNILPIMALIYIYLGSFNTLRWSFTLLCSGFYITFIEEEKFFKAFIFSLLLAGIQFASYVLLVPIFVYRITNKFKNKKLILVNFILYCLVTLIPVFVDITAVLLFVGHNNQRDYAGQIPITWILIYTFFICNVLYVRKDLFKEKRNINLFYTILFLIPPVFLELVFGLAYRFSYYGHPAYYIYFYRLFIVNKKYGYIGFLLNFIHCIMILVTIIIFYGRTIEASGIPYIFGFSNFIN